MNANTASLPRISKRISRFIQIAAGSILIIGLTLAVRIAGGFEAGPGTDSGTPSRVDATGRYVDEAMFVNLYDADRVHYLLREFCKDANVSLQYAGCMTQSENRPGIQLIAPTGASMWYIKGPRYREIPCRLIAANRSKNDDGWRLKIGNAPLAIVLVDPDGLGITKETKLVGQTSVDKFFADFCSFAEQRMQDYVHGIPALPRDRRLP